MFQTSTWTTEWTIWGAFSRLFLASHLATVFFLLFALSHFRPSTRRNTKLAVALFTLYFRPFSLLDLSLCWLWRWIVLLPPMHTESNTTASVGVNAMLDELIFFWFVIPEYSLFSGNHCNGFVCIVSIFSMLISEDNIHLFSFNFNQFRSPLVFELTIPPRSLFKFSRIQNSLLDFRHTQYISTLKNYEIRSKTFDRM